MMRKCLGNCNSPEGLEHCIRVMARFQEESVETITQDPSSFFPWLVCSNCRAVFLAVIGPVIDALRSSANARTGATRMSHDN